MLRLLALAGLAAVAAYPWVIDSATRYYLSRQGITIEESEVRYSGTKWTGIYGSFDGIELKAGAVSIPSLASLLGVRIKENPIIIADLEVDFSVYQPQSTRSEPKGSLSEVLASVLESLPKLELFLPQVEFSGIRIILSGEKELAIGEIAWRSGQILLREGKWQSAATESWMENIPLPIAREVTLGRRGWRTLYFKAVFSDDLSAQGKISLKASMETISQVDLAWPDGELQVQAEWDATGWIPGKLSLSGQGSGLPSGLDNPVAEFEPEILVDAWYDFSNGNFSLEMDGSGIYKAEQLGSSPLPWTVSLLAEGASQQARVARMNIDLPGLKAQLDNELVLDRSTWLPSDPACFKWDLDLAASPFAQYSGMATGTACLRPLKGNKSASFSVLGRADDLVFPARIWPDTVNKIQFTAEGTFDETRLDVSRLEVSAPEMVFAEGRLEWPFEKAMPTPIQLEGQLFPALVERWVKSEQLKLSPAGIEFSLQAHNDSSEWIHSGKVSAAEVLIRNNVDARIMMDWHGAGRNLEQFNMEFSRDQYNLTGRGSLTWKEDALELRISDFVEERMAQKEWSLSQPTQLVYHFRSNDRSAEWILPSLILSHREGALMNLDGRWNSWSDLYLKGEITDLSLSDFDPFIGKSLWSTATIESCTFMIGSEPDPSGGHVWSGEGTFAADWKTAENRMIAGGGGWSIDDSRVLLTDMSIAVDGEKWFYIDGIVPVRLTGTKDQVFTYAISPGEPLEFEIVLEPIQSIPGILSEKLPFNVYDLSASLMASGTFANPSARIMVSAGMLDWSRSDEANDYSVSDLELNATVGVESLQIENLSLRLPDARGAESITAEVHDINWVTLAESMTEYPWNDLSGSAIIDNWPVASLGSFLPEGFLPKGHFSLNTTKESGNLPVGSFSFNGLTWRALDAGIIARDMSGRAHLDGRLLNDLELTASVGGGEVVVKGWMDFAVLKDPRFNISLEADRVDMIRRSDLILRGKSSLEAVYDKDDPAPLLRGEIEMIRSLWLKDLQDFTQKGVAGVSQRPPFFAVKTEPFSNWRLDLNIYGENFLRLQSTILRGTASAEFNLRGTLGDPILVGSASVTDGSIIFPFANLRTSGIESWISENEPHTIRLSGSGEGVVYGYLVQYQLSGTSELPSIAFSSIPSLAQQDILLMLTTGAVPSAELTSNITQRTSRLGFFIGQDYFSSLIGSEGASRLEFRTGDGFSPFQREGQLLEYRINDRWSIIGEYDDYGSYNVDVRRILLQR